MAGRFFFSRKEVCRRQEIYRAVDSASLSLNVLTPLSESVRQITEDVWTEYAHAKGLISPQVTPFHLGTLLQGGVAKAQIESLVTFIVVLTPSCVISLLECGNWEWEFGQNANDFAQILSDETGLRLDHSVALPCSELFLGIGYTGGRELLPRVFPQRPSTQPIELISALRLVS